MDFIKEEGRIYSLNSNGQVIAEITYVKEEDNYYNINHTYVSDVLRGQGIGKILLKLAIEDIESKNGKVRATCEYAKAQLMKDKEKLT